MRLLEVCRLGIKDVDFERQQIMVRTGTGEKDRAVPLPMRCKTALQAQIASTRRVHEQERAAGSGDVWLPSAIGEKHPAGSCEWVWQSVFPAKSRGVDPRAATPSSGLSATFSPASRGGEGTLGSGESAGLGESGCEWTVHFGFQS